MKLPPPPWLVAHRGASGERLENTVEACRLAVEAGAPMLEIDVQLAADGELMVFHDADLVRLGGGDRRTIEGMSSRELAAVDLALERPDESAGTLLRGRAPTLAELLAALPPAWPLNVEIKRFEADHQRVADAVARAVGGRANVLVSSFDWQQLAAVRARLPELPLAPIERRRAEALVEAGEQLGAWGLHAHRRLARAELAAAAKAAGRALLVYTVNDAAEARSLFDLGVSGVFTDYPARLLRELAAVAPC